MCGKQLRVLVHERVVAPLMVARLKRTEDARGNGAVNDDLSLSVALK